MYIAANDFKFYTDSQALNLMPLEEVRKGDFVELWTGLTHHVLHCAYIWRLLGLSATEGRPFDSLSSSEDHTGHCTAILLHGLVVISVTRSSTLRYSVVLTQRIGCRGPNRSLEMRAR